MKKCILFITIGLTLGVGITIGAYQYSANDITYIPKNSEWKVSDVKSAIDDLKDHDKMVYDIGPIHMGSSAGLYNYTPIIIDGIDKYKKMTVSCTGSMGTYISANVILDGNLALTISDDVSHVINLNNNSVLSVSYITYNNLSLGNISIHIELE